jgi:hypothetical protein
MHTPLHSLQMYVANRVNVIHDLTPLHRWSHVNSENNAADVASRGCSASDLIGHNSWWHGPAFIQQHSSLLHPPGYTRSGLEVPELKADSATSLVVNASSAELLSVCTKYSSFRTAQRVTAYVLRFICATLKRQSTQPIILKAQGLVRPNVTLLPEELHIAIALLVSQVQQHHFLEEIRLLHANTTPPRWKALSPFVDELGVLRVGGRLHHADLPEDAKHPALLPKDAHLSSIIVDHFHTVNAHPGPRTTQALTTAQFWILSARTLVRRRVHQCLVCSRFRSATPQPFMGSLPASRVNHQRPFLATSLDYAGPFNVKISSLRNAKIIKGYLCLFVCMSTKALHLEFVSDVSTSSFISSFERFVSRRGLPHEVHSDNGTNFRGAAKRLEEIYDLLKSSEAKLTTYFTDKRIQWHFQPPYAPHFGGLHERRSVREKRSVSHCR